MGHNEYRHFVLKSFFLPTAKPTVTTLVICCYPAARLIENNIHMRSPLVIFSQSYFFWVVQLFHRPKQILQRIGMHPFYSSFSLNYLLRSSAPLHLLFCQSPCLFASFKEALSFCCLTAICLLSDQLFR